MNFMCDRNYASTAADIRKANKNGAEGKLKKIFRKTQVSLCRFLMFHKVSSFRAIFSNSSQALEETVMEARGKNSSEFRNAACGKTPAQTLQDYYQKNSAENQGISSDRSRIGIRGYKYNTGLQSPAETQKTVL